MHKKREISQYREKLDKTLASPELTNEEALKILIREQLSSSSLHGNEECEGDILDKWTTEVSNFLDKLRSASVKDHQESRRSEASHGDWKLKHDCEDFRVMYREGPHGGPFHTLLVEGYVDGPVEACLCVSWESSLYKKWWPQSAFPSFKITQNNCLQKIRIREQICLVRMKVPWPLTDREAVVHFFLFEYFKDDLIVVLMNTVSDLESMENSSDGLTKNGIPEALDAVRIDLVGGFALQKVTPERSYFRTIAALDIKLDLIPPSLINFISRQLVGNGFRLYQKSVASVAKFDEDYNKALEDPLYTQIRKALYSTWKLDEAYEENELKGQECAVAEEEGTQQSKGKDKEPKLESNEQDAECLAKNEPDEECKNEKQQSPHSDIHASKNEPVSRRKAFCEIEEEEQCEESVASEDGPGDVNVIAKNRTNGTRRVCVSPEVEQALGTLERVISMVRKYRRNTKGQSTYSSSFSDEELPPNIAEDPSKQLSPSDNIQIVSSSKVSVEALKTEAVDRTSLESQSGSGRHNFGHIGSSSLTREGNHHNRIAPASPAQHLPTSAVTSITGMPEMTFLGQNTEINRQTGDETGETREISVQNGGKNSTLQRKHRLCCFKSWY